MEKDILCIKVMKKIRKKKKKADIFGYTKLEDICVLKGKPKTSKFNTGLHTEHL